MLTLAVSVLAAATVLLLLTAPTAGDDAGVEPPSAPAEPWDGSATGPAAPAPPGGPVRRGARGLVDTVRARLADRSRVTAEVQLLDDVSAALEAGLPVGRAVGLALAHGPAGSAREQEAWVSLSRTALEGQELAPAWARAARATGSPALAVVARAWRVASLSGAPLADALRVSAHTARERQRLERAVDTATAGARATATVLTLLPLAGVGLAALLGVPPTTLYGSPMAWASVGTGAALLLLGQVLVRRLVGRVLGDLR